MKFSCDSVIYYSHRKWVFSKMVFNALVEEDKIVYVNIYSGIDFGFGYLFNT